MMCVMDIGAILTKGQPEITKYFLHILGEGK